MIAHQDDTVTLFHGDCLDVLRTLPDCSVDAVVTDPPYGLEFMGKEWDKFATARGNMSSPGIGERQTEWPSGQGWNAKRCRKCGHLPHGGSPCNCDAPEFVFDVSRWHAFQAWCQEWAAECLRVLRPGGHLLAFGGTRTWHRLACAIEDAGFEVRDSIAWMYGSGFPKSLDVSKAIDKAAGATREVVGVLPSSRGITPPLDGREFHMGNKLDTAPATDDARTWQGWGTALKPGWEGLVCAHKPPTALDRIGSRLQALEDQCRQRASDAAKSSAPTRADSSAGRTDTARASAATQPEGEAATLTQTGEAADSSAQTATSWSEWQATTSSNIVTSWKLCWAALSEQTNTSTTETTSGTTTDLTTLSSCLSKLTEPSTLLDPTSPDGLSSHARIVDNLFAAAWLTWSATRTLTATEPVTSPTQAVSRDEGARPQLEPIVVARRPLDGTVAATVLRHGTGALNIDACRVAGDVPQVTQGLSRDPSSWEPRSERRLSNPHAAGRWPANVVLDESQAAALDTMSGEQRARGNITPTRSGESSWFMGAGEDEVANPGDQGGASRFFYIAREDNEPCLNHDPANTAETTSPPPNEPDASAPNDAATSDSRADNCKSSSTAPSTTATANDSKPNGANGTPTTPTIAPESSPESQLTKPSQMVSRARYAASLSQTDITTTTADLSTSAGCADPATSGTMPTSRAPGDLALPLDTLDSRFAYTAKAPTDERPRINGVAHPTTKPLSLMRWLVRLVTPPGGTILEPFAGSGTTVEAAILEGFRCIAIEREADYLPLIRQRINRRRDPVAAVKATGDDGGLFDLLGEEPVA